MDDNPVRAERVSEEASGEQRALARLLPLFVPVVAAGGAVLVASILSVGVARPTAASFIGIVALLLAAFLAEAYPVPVETLPDGHVSLAAVFFVGAAVLFGPAEAAIVAVSVRATLDLLQRRPRVRLLYNSAAYALSAAAAGAAAWWIDGRSDALLVLEVVLAAAAYYVVNVVVVSAAMARWDEQPYFELLAQSVYWTILPFSIMSSGTLMLAVLWDRSPLLSLALIGPLLAVALYQRSVHRALVATRLALTDPLTGLGNQRHFQERLQQELDAAERARRPLALCLLDVDALKGVNDTHGHLAGDRLLQQLAGSLRQGGEAFRVGGDEFALVLPGRDEKPALIAAESLLARIEPLRISAGIAVFPTSVSVRSELYRAADDALYTAKRSGGNQVSVYRRPTPPDLRSISGGS
jgi:diguanylate cyclase (GGDEF)-like protein